ncbi:hypothetical protein DESUT3_12100 [Desulfuromonas versatilis]|uniref:DUF1573 domain-containing protein n=1 Tax=Desulfuromonas versatilis TaxID=2802975 RepID=A0ABM8HQN5_9BACT|nr:DUF1573 domain-containing protein [Desulfuromonas versatilis]BCR04141.1 hypothetical protein DESUT3_12100 [Desulfuromonas versatilis]
MIYRFLLVLLVLLLPAIAFGEGSPRLAVENADYSFGKIYAGMKVEHTFRFKNSGDAPLMIDRVRSSCGCTAALLSSTIIGAGEIGEVKTTFDSARFKGAVVKTIYLYSNDPTQSVTQLYIRGTVQEEIEQEPAKVDMRALVPGATKEARVTLTNQGDKELLLSNLQVTASELKAEVTADRLAVGESAEVIIRATPKEGQAHLSGYVIISTSSANMPELRIPVYGAVAVAKPGT